MGLAAFAVLSLAPAYAFQADIADFKLANGLEVVVIPDHRAPVVTHMVWYRVGSADEPEGVGGIAHFLEHLMFKGTRKFKEGEFSKIIEANGGEDNAFTTKDYTAYFQHVAKDRLGAMMELEADRMQNLELTEEQVLPERQVIIEERRERIDNDPSSLLSEQVEAAMFTAHPYGRPVIGWKNQMEKLSRADAIAFYRRFYTPANAILVVAGDVTEAEVKALAEQYYGSLKNTFEVSPRVRPMEPDPIAPRRVTVKDARVAAPLLQRSYLAPSYSRDDGLEAEALDVLAEALGGGSTSILYQRLVVDQKIASYIGAWYSSGELDYGSFGVYAAPMPGQDLSALEIEIDKVLEEVKANGIPAAEIVRAKNKLDADVIYGQDSQSSMARLFGAALTTGQTVADVLGWTERIKKVSPDDIQKAAAKVLDIRRSVTGILLPDRAK